jgi:NADH dehydrogenase FAD-containing subunit
MRERKVVLVGGGHAHVQMIKALNSAALPPRTSVTVIDCQSSAVYSGMMPGCVSNLYSIEEVTFEMLF